MIATSPRALAARLLDARRRSVPVADPGDGDFSMDAGYAVQDLMVEQAIADGRRIAGWKIGLTSAAALSRFGAHEPMVGRIFADTILRDKAFLDPADTCNALIEGEVLIEIDALPGAGADDAALLASIRSIRPAIEIADSRIIGWPKSAGLAIADNACCGWIVRPDKGERASADRLASIVAEIEEDGRVMGAGKASDNLGGILSIYRWFVHRAYSENWPVAPGDLLMTGALGHAVPLQSGRQYRLCMAGFEPVGLQIGSRG